MFHNKGANHFQESKQVELVQIEKKQLESTTVNSKFAKRKPDKLIAQDIPDTVDKVKSQKTSMVNLRTQFYKGIVS